MSFSNPARRMSVRMISSAADERQIFPKQTKSILCFILAVCIAFVAISACLWFAFVIGRKSKKIKPYREKVSGCLC